MPYRAGCCTLPKMHHIPLTTDQQQLAEALDGHLREAQQLAQTLELAGVTSGLGGLALRQCGELLEEAGVWSTGVLVTGARPITPAP